MLYEKILEHKRLSSELEDEGVSAFSDAFYLTSEGMLELMREIKPSEVRKRGWMSKMLGKYYMRIDFTVSDLNMICTVKLDDLEMVFDTLDELGIVVADETDIDNIFD